LLVEPYKLVYGRVIAKIIAQSAGDPELCVPENHCRKRLGAGFHSWMGMVRFFNAVCDATGIPGVTITLRAISPSTEITKKHTTAFLM
jgi:hypothetical protein